MTIEILSMYIVVPELSKEVNEYIYGPTKNNRVINEFKDLFYPWVRGERDLGCVCLRSLKRDTRDYIFANWRFDGLHPDPKDARGHILNFRKILYKLKIDVQKGPDKDHSRTGFNYIK